MAKSMAWTTTTVFILFTKYPYRTNLQPQDNNIECLYPMSIFELQKRTTTNNNKISSRPNDACEDTFMVKSRDSFTTVDPNNPIANDTRISLDIYTFPCISSFKLSCLFYKNYVLGLEYSFPLDDPFYPYIRFLASYRVLTRLWAYLYISVFLLILRHITDIRLRPFVMRNLKYLRQHNTYDSFIASSITASLIYQLQLGGCVRLNWHTAYLIRPSDVYN